jgi:hypothetical protein
MSAILYFFLVADSAYFQEKKLCIWTWLEPQTCGDSGLGLHKTKKKTLYNYVKGFMYSIEKLLYLEIILYVGLINIFEESLKIDCHASFYQFSIWWFCLVVEGREQGHLLGSHQARASGLLPGDHA